jgi:hypothetical protein
MSQLFARAAKHWLHSQGEKHNVHSKNVDVGESGRGCFHDDLLPRRPEAIHEDEDDVGAEYLPLQAPGIPHSRSYDEIAVSVSHAQEMEQVISGDSE